MEKLPIKRVELSLSKFNNVAIPHHLCLLKRHKENITKYTLLGDLIHLKSEEINARRTVFQLKNLLQEMDILRQRVIDKDIDKFDKLTKTSLVKSLAAIKEYLDLYQRNMTTLEGNKNCNNETVQRDKEIEISPVQTSNRVQKADSPDNNLIQLIVDDDEMRLSEKQECLRAWANLHAEMEELHGLFVKFQETLDLQRCNVDQTENNVVQTAENVSVARRHLSRAEKYGAVVYPLTCAAIGGCLGGPIGLLLGIKIGGAAALGGSLIGYTGGRFLKRQATAEKETANPQNDTADKKVKDHETELFTLPPG